METFYFKKKYGQNFLKNPKILEKIAAIPCYQEDSLVMEVGPGGGALTKQLAKQVKQVVCYEIDHDLEDPLAIALQEFSNVKLFFEDFLKRDIVKDISSFHYQH